MSYNNPRLDLMDTGMGMLMKMSDGNPGALTVLMRTFQECAAIDPDSAFGEIGVVMSLDTHDIYGHEIWGLYKDVAGEDLVDMIALLRAIQMGFASEGEIKRAIADRGLGAERKAELIAQVFERLPNFGASKRAAIAKATGSAK